MKARRVVATRRTIVFRFLLKNSGLSVKATLRWMRNVLPLAFTRTRGSFFNVAALTRPRPTDRFTNRRPPSFHISPFPVLRSPAEGYIKDQAIRRCPAKPPRKIPHSAARCKRNLSARSASENRIAALRDQRTNRTNRTYRTHRTYRTIREDEPCARRWHCGPACLVCPVCLSPHL